MKATAVAAPAPTSSGSSSSSSSSNNNNENALSLPSSRHAAGAAVDNSSISSNNSDPSSKHQRFQKPRKQAYAKGPRKPYPPHSRRGDGQQFGSLSNPGYNSRNHFYHDQDRNAVIFFDSASYETKECNVDSPFYFELNQSDLLLSEKTAHSLRQLYDSFTVESDIRNYIQMVAASCETYLLLQQRNVNEFYETRKRMEQSAATASHVQQQPFHPTGGSGHSTSSS